MRTSIVPAQITTVEDRIVGNFSIQQSALVGVPILLGFGIVNIFPPLGYFTSYKILIALSLLVICSSLAIRIKDRIIFHWVKLFVAYWKKPSLYIYDKNSDYLRDKNNFRQHSEEDKPATQPIDELSPIILNISPKQLVRLEKIVIDTHSELKFKFNRKGELNVYIPKIK